MAITKKKIKPMLGSVLVAIVLWVMVATDKNYDGAYLSNIEFE